MLMLMLMLMLMPDAYPSSLSLPLFCLALVRLAILAG